MLMKLTPYTSYEVLELTQTNCDCTTSQKF